MLGSGSSLEARVSYLEQIIIIIILGGGHIPVVPPKGDSFSADITRLSALSRLAGGGDISQLSATDIESSVHQVNAELVRLRALETQMNARLKELRAK